MVGRWGAFKSLFPAIWNDSFCSPNVCPWASSCIPANTSNQPHLVLRCGECAWMHCAAGERGHVGRCCNRDVSKPAPWSTGGRSKRCTVPKNSGRITKTGGAAYWRSLQLSYIGLSCTDQNIVEMRWGGLSANSCPLAGLPVPWQALSVNVNAHMCTGMRTGKITHVQNDEPYMLACEAGWLTSLFVESRGLCPSVSVTQQRGVWNTWVTWYSSETSRIHVT